MSGKTGQASVFLHQGRTIVSTPGMHEMGEEITHVLQREHENHMVHLRVEQKEFANGESLPLIPDTVRGEQVFLLSALQHPHPDIAFMQMMRTSQALQLASVECTTLVLPYFSYARQDRKAKPREPISARLNANIIETVSANERVITSDLHAAQVQGFFKIPVDDLPALPVQEAHLRQHFGGLRNVTVVTPDLGGNKRAEVLAKRLRVPVAIIDKRRQPTGEVETFAIIGDVNGRDCVIVDDMVDGGGTLRNAVADLMAHGAKSVVATVTHAILSGEATEKFRASGVKLIATDTIPRDAAFREKNSGWLTILPVAAMFAHAIHEASLVGGSVSKLSVAAA